VRAFVTAIMLVAACAACAAEADATGCGLTIPATAAVGSYDPTVIGTTTIVTFTVMFACDAGSPATNLSISAGPGAHATGGTFDTRTMTAGGSDRLNYWLYPPGFVATPHSSANVWGDGSKGSRVWGPFSVTGGAAATSGSASIQVDSNQDVAAGTYSDTVVFMMTFV
jgi:spore coat protein U-like protein